MVGMLSLENLAAVYKTLLFFPGDLNLRIRLPKLPSRYSTMILCEGDCGFTSGPLERNEIHRITRHTQ